LKSISLERFVSLAKSSCLSQKAELLAQAVVVKDAAAVTIVIVDLAAVTEAIALTSVVVDAAALDAGTKFRSSS